MGGLLRVLIACVAALVAGCASIPTTDQGAGATIAEYRLGSGDQIRLIVFDQGNLSGDFLVDGAGTVSLPLIGGVEAGGKTSGQLEQAIAARLRGAYLVDPRVSVQVILFRPYYILGEINRPGEYPSAVGLTVLNAVATAGGFTYRAKRHRVYIRHANDSTEKQFKLNGETRVMPGDTIRIPERFF